MLLDCPYVKSSQVLFYNLSLDGQSRYFTVDNRTALCNVTLDTGYTYTQSNYNLIKLFIVLFAYFITWTVHLGYVGSSTNLSPNEVHNEMFNTLWVIYGTIISVIVVAGYIVTIAISVLFYSRKYTKKSESTIFKKVE